MLPSRDRLLWLAAGAAALVAMTGAAFAAEELARGPTVCVFRAVTGISCPGCGLTRAFAWLGRGELGRAFALHPFAPLLAVEAALAWGLWGTVLAGRTTWPSERTLLTILWGNLGAIALVWGARLATGTLP